MSLNYDMTINGNYTFNYKTFKMKDNKFNLSDDNSDNTKWKFEIKNKSIYIKLANDIDDSNNTSLYLNIEKNNKNIFLYNDNLFDFKDLIKDISENDIDSNLITDDYHYLKLDIIIDNYEYYIISKNSYTELNKMIDKNFIEDLNSAKNNFIDVLSNTGNELEDEEKTLIDKINKISNNLTNDKNDISNNDIYDIAYIKNSDNIKYIIVRDKGETLEANGTTYVEDDAIKWLKNNNFDTKNISWSNTGNNADDTVDAINNYKESNKFKMKVSNEEERVKVLVDNYIKLDKQKNNNFLFYIFVIFLLLLNGYNNYNVISLLTNGCRSTFNGFIIFIIIGILYSINSIIPVEVEINNGLETTKVVEKPTYWVKFVIYPSVLLLILLIIFLISKNGKNPYLYILLSPILLSIIINSILLATNNPPNNIMYLIIYYVIFIIICFVLAFNKEQQISDVLSLQKIGFIVLFLSLI